MRKLTAYLARLFAVDATILFAIVCFLLWLVNCLRSFDVVAAKGQGFGMLALQALYTMPPLAISFFYICVGIGMVRALTALQASHELHIVHTSRGLGGLWRAAAISTGIAVVFALLLAHFIEPWANRQVNDLNEAVAADLVSSSLRPGRFTQITPGVVLLIGGRETGGIINEFYADDRRDPTTRRTYIAASAQVMADGENYFLQLRDGTLQYLESDGSFSEVRYTQYELSVDSLSQSAAAVDSLSVRDSYELLAEGFSTQEWPTKVVKRLLDRSAEGLRVIGLCMLVVAVAGFPSGNRTRFRLPLEAIVMLVAFGERGISAYSPLGSGTGAVLLIVVAALILLFRLWPRRLRKAVLV